MRPSDVLDPRSFTYTVNGRTLETSDPVIDGRAALQSSGNKPASDHILIRLTRPGTQVFGLDETLDLRTVSAVEFMSFLADRTFEFTIDEVGYAWGAAQIAEEELRRISLTPADSVLILDRDDKADSVLNPGDSVNLAEPGTEHILTEKRLVTVFYRDIAFELERGRYTGAELSTKFGVPANYQLDLVKPDGEFREIGPSESLKVRDGMRFVSHPPSGHSS